MKKNEKQTIKKKEFKIWEKKIFQTKKRFIKVQMSDINFNINKGIILIFL